MSELITTPEGREAVPVGTVIHSADGTIACRYDATRGVVFGDDRSFPWKILALPLTVLWPQPPKPIIGYAVVDDYVSVCTLDQARSISSALHRPNTVVALIEVATDE